jgi:P-type Cu+ transporter
MPERTCEHILETKEREMAIQEQTVTVNGGYSPSTLRVKAGQPVRLTFDRQERSPCSAELVIPEFGIRTALPEFDRTIVEFTPDRAGTYGFACGMDMLRGHIIVEPEAESVHELESLTTQSDRGDDQTCHVRTGSCCGAS